MQHTIAVDLAKSVFQVAESTRPGQVAGKKRLTRAQFARYIEKQPKARFLLEACGSSHFWARWIEENGHSVALLPPHRWTRHIRA